ncbi:MAG: serine/threonine-protein kinase [Sandaracinus sp.]
MDAVSDIENALGAELLRSSMLRRDPPKIGRYIVERILGRGASGLVVAALDDRLNRPVALKLRPAEGDSEMLAEGRALARLDHPNVVRVHDVDVVAARLDGREFKLWLVSMARIEGRTMRAWLREKTRTPSELLAVCVDVARGLAAAHDAHIVHRDVKPDNVIVRSDGVAQILDFGFAVQAGSTQSDVGGLRPTAGTAPYMSPEARLGRTSRKSDQFSLGVTLVEALRGVPMPAGRRAPAGVSRVAWAVAQRATAPDPQDRFPDMQAMATELTRAAQAPVSSITPKFAVVAIGLGAAMVSLALWLWGQGSDEPHALPVMAPSLDGGSHRADAATPDTLALVPPDHVDPPTTVDAGAHDARRCALPSDGPHRFRTRRTHGGAPHSATSGTYLLGIQIRRRAIQEISLRKTAPRADTLDVQHFGMTDDCELHLEARAENRRYEFWLTFDGDAVSGRFEATDDPSQPDFGGVIEPDLER